MEETKPPIETAGAINAIAASTAESIELLEDMADALLNERPDLKESVDRHVREIKGALVEQYFGTAYFGTASSPDDVEDAVET